MRPWEAASSSYGVFLSRAPCDPSVRGSTDPLTRLGRKRNIEDADGPLRLQLPSDRPGLCRSRMAVRHLDPSRPALPFLPQTLIPRKRPVPPACVSVWVWTFQPETQTPAPPRPVPFLHFPSRTIQSEVSAQSRASVLWLGGAGGHNGQIKSRSSEGSEGPLWVGSLVRRPQTPRGGTAANAGPPRVGVRPQDGEDLPVGVGSGARAGLGTQTRERVQEGGGCYRLSQVPPPPQFQWSSPDLQFLIVGRSLELGFLKRS